MFSGASEIVISGGNLNTITTSQSKRGMDLLFEYIAADAMHDSADQYDAPKCHPRTRVAVLDGILKWVIESEAQEEFIMWLYGPAGAGKSAIARKIAELAAEQGLLIGTFFFSRTASTRNTQDRLIATLAYQLTVTIPGTRAHIEDAIEQDPAIFHKNIPTQIDTLIMKPFQSASMDSLPFPKLIIIDGLDECNDSKTQVAILNAISCSLTTRKLPIKCLVTSRPETAIVSSFNGNEPLRSIHRRLALDDTYHPDDDIRLFFSDKFEEIRCTHRLRSSIPVPWPTEESLEMLVKRSAGQFIFAATVVRYVGSDRHRPAARLNIILEISPPGTINPFTELDALYKQIISSVDDIPLTLRVLSLYISSPSLAAYLDNISISEHFLSLEEGDIELALIDLSSIVLYDNLSGKVTILHASLVDFLSDPHRSNEFYIDMASARADFICRTLQYVGPDGIRAGDIHLFEAGITGDGWIPSLGGNLRSEILNFDLDAFIAAAKKTLYSPRLDAIGKIFHIWMPFIHKLMPTTEFEDADARLLIHRYKDSFESRIQKYESHWRLQLLLALAQVISYSSSHWQVPLSRCLDILLEINDDDLRLNDQDALDFRHSTGDMTDYNPELIDIISCYVDGDRYASVALHCMCFLSNPPKYSETKSNDSSEMGITYAEWKATCHMALLKLCELLDRANTSPELIQFMTDHDIDTTVQNNFPIIDTWQLDIHILEFLSRADVCVNWRIISAIQRGLSATNSEETPALGNFQKAVNLHRPTTNLAALNDADCAHFHPQEKIGMRSFWIVAERALKHAREHQSQIEAIFAAHGIKKSDFVLYAGFDESLIHAEVGYLEQIHVFSLASITASSESPEPNLLSQLGKLFSPFSSILFTESSNYELPVYKPDGTKWIFDDLVLQTASKLVDRASTADIPTIISMFDPSAPGESNTSGGKPPTQSGSNNQGKKEGNKKGKQKENDESRGSDNEENDKDDPGEDSDDPDGDKDPENPATPPTFLFDFVSEIVILRNGVEERFQILGMQGKIMTQEIHRTSCSECDVKFVKLNFDTEQGALNKRYEQTHLRVTIDPRDQNAEATVKQPRQTSASDGEIKGVSGWQKSLVQTGSIGVSLTGVTPRGTVTVGSNRTSQTSGTTEQKQYTSQITEKTLYGVVRWGFQIDDESDQKGGIKIPGVKLPHAYFEFDESKSKSDNVSPPRFVDVEVASYWSLMSSEKYGRKWLLNTMFSNAETNNMVYSNMCQAVALIIPSNLTKRSSYKATLKVNIGDPELRPKTKTVRVNDDEVGTTASIDRAHYDAIEHGRWGNESLLDLITIRRV